jgi:DNA polymerase III epsilon subunit-like protein
MSTSTWYPDRSISDGARRVHGLSLEDLEGKRASERVYDLEEGLRHAVERLSHFQSLNAYVVGVQSGAILT